MVLEWMIIQCVHIYTDNISFFLTNMHTLLFSFGFGYIIILTIIWKHGCDAYILFICTYFTLSISVTCIFWWSMFLIPYLYNDYISSGMYLYDTYFPLVTYFYDAQICAMGKCFTTLIPHSVHILTVTICLLVHYFTMHTLVWEIIFTMHSFVHVWVLGVLRVAIRQY